jgi:hypothetical protein
MGPPAINYLDVKILLPVRDSDRERYQDHAN